MAVRDRNLFVWQAYVIATSIISLILLIGLFFLWRAYSDKVSQYETQGQQLASARQDFTTANQQVDRLLSMMGVGQWTESDLQNMAEKAKQDPKLQVVEQEFAKAQSLFPANTPLSDKNLLKLPQTLIETIRKRNEELAEIRSRTVALQTQMEKEIEDHRRALETAEIALKQASNELEEVRSNHREQLAAFGRDVQEELQKHEAAQAKFEAQLAEVSADKNRLAEENRTKAEAIAKQTKMLQEFLSPDYATPQGMIIDVQDGGSMVWINLGKANGLTKGIPFSILDANETSTTKAVPKANMVIEHVSDNIARGRVFFDETDPEARRRYFRNMAKRGDQVYSPAWRPGRKVGFALVGKMDVSGDYSDEIDTVRQLIRNAGGTIDAELPAKGNPTPGLPGLSPNTSYLVIGTDVATIAQNPSAGDKAREYARFIDEARENGVMQISVDKLLGLLKVDESARVVPLGDRSRGSDFPVRSPISAPRGTSPVSEIYSPPLDPKS
jgi:hypothetical protein